MKKLFTLLTLLVAIVTGAWASTVDDLTTITSATTIIANTLNGTTALADATLYADGKVLCVGGCGYGEKSEVTYGNTDYTPVYQIKSNRQLVLKIGFDASITVVGSTNGSRAWRIGTSSAGNEIASGGNGDNFATGTIDGSSETKTIYINASSDLYLAAIIITANSSTAPAINASSSISIKATESGTEVTEDINVTGKNLKGNTLTATFNPSVTGLSVTLGSSTISAGSLSTTATLHYTQTVNASGSTTLTLSDGTTTKDITVNYKATVVPSELEPISARTTFDLSKVGTDGMQTISEDDNYVVLSDAGSDVSFADNIAVSCISGVGVTWRSDAVQAPLFKFKTDVPGNVTLKFSDVGSKDGRAKRYAAVNNELTDVYSTTSASSGVVTCSPISVEAGEVIIKGQVEGENNTYTHNQIRVFEIVFTPNKAVTITAAGWATLYTPDALDFAKAKPAGLKAYTATLNDNIVTLTKVDNVPAQTGVVLKGAANTYSIPVIANSETPQGDMKGSATSGTPLAEGAAYILGINNTTGKAQFFINSAGTIEAGKAYLPAGNTNTNEAKALSVVFADDMTGITNANAAEEAAQPAKRIVNGQLVIEKNGKRYNAAGAEF